MCESCTTGQVVLGPSQELSFPGRAGVSPPTLTKGLNDSKCVYKGAQHFWL